MHCFFYSVPQGRKEHFMQDLKKPEGILIIEDRKNVSISGVKSIIGFGDDYVSLETDLGRLLIEGEGMKIESLEKGEGNVNITGLISSAYYSEIKQKQGLISRLFS